MTGEQWYTADDLAETAAIIGPESWGGGNGASPELAWEPLKASDFLALPEPKDVELLGPLVLRGGRTIVGGDSGHGKTTLSLAMAAAILTGGELLGYAGAGVGPLLVIDLEQGIRSIKRGIRESGLDKTDTHILTLPDGLALDREPKEMQALEKTVDELRPAVIVLDPYYKAHRGDSNEERAVTDLMRNLDRLRTDYVFALLLPAHVRKEQQTNGPRKLTLADVAGSGAISRGAEVVLGIERLSHGHSRLRYLKDREGDLPVGDSIELTYSKEEGFVVEERPKSQTIEEMILGLNNSGWMTPKEWARELKLRDAETKRVLDRLAATGQIEHMIGPPGRKHNSNCFSTSGDPKLPEHQGSPGSARGDAALLSADPASLLGEAESGAAASRAAAPSSTPDQQDDDIPF